jgi:hypothetical protein
MHCGSNPIAQCPPEKSNGSRDNYSSNNCTSPNPIDGLFERPYFFTMLPHILNQAIKLRAKLAKLYHHKSNVRRRVKVLRRAARKLSRGSCFLFKIWHAAFATFTQNVGGSLAAIVAAQSTPERIDQSLMRLLRQPHRSSMISKSPAARPELRLRPSHHEPHLRR